MIPTALNPHGLETRTLTFHTILHVGSRTPEEDGILVTTNRMYCWAEFPSDATSISNKWTLDYNNITKESDWNSCTKYTTKDGNNPYMVEGDVHFYYHVF